MGGRRERAERGPLRRRRRRRARLRADDRALLTFGYVGALLGLIERRPAWVAWLRYPGRMSLTTYLLQSLVLATVFGPWGLGFYQRLPYWGTVLVAVAPYGALAGLAWLVLGRFRRGPFEWVMSAWTRAWGRTTR